MKPGHILLAAVLVIAARADESTSPDPFMDLIQPLVDFAKRNNLKLVSSTTDLNKSSVPAKFSWSDSRVGDRAILADVGLKFELKSLEAVLGIQDTTIIQPSVEYHRDTTNTSTGREKQNSIIAGLVSETEWNPGSGRLKPILKSSITYKNDRVDKGQGVQASIGGSAFDRKLWLNYMDRNSNSPLSWSPVFELQWENKNGIEPATKPSKPSTAPLDGNVTRGKGSLAVAAWPLRRSFGQRIELTARYDGWLNLNRSGYFKSYHRFQRITTVGISLWVNNDRNAGVGLDFSNGENPEKGKARDQSTEIAFKVQF